jgi:hypothetical protein
MLDRLAREWVFEEAGRFDPAYVAELHRAILSAPGSDLFAPARGHTRAPESTLGIRFEGTKGFSLVCTRAGLGPLACALPAFATWIGEAVQPWSNAYYINSLVLDHGAAVGPHLDASLTPFVGRRVVPVAVSVTYVRVPRDLIGGELVLRYDGRKIATITPREGTLAFFRGDLAHEVRRVRASEPRVSLVCEQYGLDDEALARIPLLAPAASPSYA